MAGVVVIDRDPVEAGYCATPKAEKVVLLRKQTLP